METHRSIGLNILLSILILGACSHKEPAAQATWPSKGPSVYSPAPPVPNPLAAPWMKWVTIEQIEKSLPEQPISVGFDVDDTVLFSSPGSFYGLSNKDGSGGKNKYGENVHRKEQFFNEWTDIHDKYSLPKYTARQLIDLHQKRNDKIYFITARPYSGKSEKLSARLQSWFQIQKMNPVIFNGFKEAKSAQIQRLGIEIYYGDADTDITEARVAKARAIRILRAVNSTDDREVRYGSFGEEVLVDSDR